MQNFKFPHKKRDYLESLSSIIDVSSFFIRKAHAIYFERAFLYVGHATKLAG